MELLLQLKDHFTHQMTNAGTMLRSNRLRGAYLGGIKVSMGILDIKFDVSLYFA